MTPLSHPSPSPHSSFNNHSCGTCAIVTCLPCGLAILHGQSTRRFLGGGSTTQPRAWWATWPALSFGLLTLGAWVVRAPFVVRTESTCYPLDVHAPAVPASLAAACARGRKVEAVTRWVAMLFTLCGLCLAAARRVAARRRHGLGGGRGGRWPAALLLASDALAWLCCPACAACQEARTAAAACEGGEWKAAGGRARTATLPGEVGEEEAPPPPPPAPFSR